MLAFREGNQCLLLFLQRAAVGGAGFGAALLFGSRFAAVTAFFTAIVASRGRLTGTERGGAEDAEGQNDGFHRC